MAITDRKVICDMMEFQYGDHDVLAKMVDYDVEVRQPEEAGVVIENSQLSVTLLIESAPLGPQLRKGKMLRFRVDFGGILLAGIGVHRGCRFHLHKDIQVETLVLGIYRIDHFGPTEDEPKEPTDVS